MLSKVLFNDDYVVVEPSMVGLIWWYFMTSFLIGGERISTLSNFVLNRIVLDICVVRSRI